MIDLPSVRQRIDALPTPDATTPVTRRWLEELERTVAGLQAELGRERAVAGVIAGIGR